MPPPSGQTSKHHSKPEVRNITTPSAFSEPRRPNGIICCPPPTCHFLAYSTGGLAKLFQEIRTNTQPMLHDFGKFTSDKGRFKPSEGMPLLALRYRFISVIAEGQSCIVVKALDTFKQHKEVSIKFLHLNYCKLGTQEVEVIRQLNLADSYHFSSVLRLQNTFMFDDHFCLVFDYYSPVNLMEHVKNLDKRERLHFIRTIAARLVLCLGFLQSQNVIHADLKVDNILLAVPGDPNTVRLVDFGNAIHCVHNEISLYYADFELQTLLYRAPEVIYGLPFGTEVDLWSLGIVLAQLYLGRPVVLGKSKPALLNDMVKLLGPLPRSVFQRGKFYSVLEAFTEDTSQVESVYKLMNHLGSTDYHFCDFLSGLLKYDPKQRLTPQQAAGHSFLGPVLGFGHLGASYPSLPISGRSYKNTPVVDEEISRRRLSSEELLRIGTKLRPAFQQPPVPKVKFDRLELLRNRKRQVPEQRDKEIVESATKLSLISEEQKLKSSTSFSDVDFAADISSVSDTSPNTSSEIGYVSSSSSEVVENDYNHNDLVNNLPQKSRSRVNGGRDENFNYRQRPDYELDETVVNYASPPKIPSAQSVFERYGNDIRSSAKKYENADRIVSSDCTPKLKGLKFDDKKSGKKSKTHCVEMDTKLMSPRQVSAMKRTNIRTDSPRCRNEQGLSLKVINQKYGEGMKLNLRRAKEEDSDDSDDTALLTSDVESLPSRPDVEKPRSVEPQRTGSSTSVHSGPASKGASPAGHKFDLPQPLSKKSVRGDMKIGKPVPAPTVAESLVSGVVRSTPMVKNPKVGSGFTLNLPNFGNISPIAERAPESSCKRNLPFSSAETKIQHSKRKRSTGATLKGEDRSKKSVKLGRKSLLIHEVFGDVYDFHESPRK